MEADAPIPNVRPGQKDLTSGPITRTLLVFALPTLASSILQSLNGSINAVWIGQFLGEKAIAATTNANIVMFLMFSAVFGFGMAATILIGQSIGRRDVDAARRVIGTAFGIFVLASLVTMTAGWFLAPALLRLLATPADVYPLALAYLRVIFLSMPPTFLSTLLIMSLRGTGDSLTPLWFMALSAVIDVALNPVLIRGLGPIPAMGIAGSATATLIANYVSFVSLVAYIYARDLLIRLRGPELRYILPQGALLRMIFAKGLPMGLQVLVFSTSALAMIGLVNRQGTATTAAYGASSQLWTYIQMPAMAVGAAVSAMAAQNIGAGRWDRVGLVARAGIMMNLVVTGALILIIGLADRHVLWLFLGNDDHAIAIARHINLVVSWSFALFGIGMVLTAVVRANGAVVAPLIILIVSVFPVRFMIALTGLPHWGAEALWWSFPAGSIASLILQALYYRSGRWKTLRMAVPPSPMEAEEQALSDCEPAGRMYPAG
ncbi:MATE family efflux transporter [Flavisphingomonas formosensis]|uniref:MATE family efflux transporter n=1 Tax=Flavisphingomonas formosensis TaxID=861534 RepID=UPI0012FC5AAF|nr:MATE family efflux transporter [Sphingomonas formosensis]